MPVFYVTGFFAFCSNSFVCFAVVIPSVRFLVDNKFAGDIFRLSFIKVFAAFRAMPVSFGAVFRARCRFFGDDFRCGPNVSIFNDRKFKFAGDIVCAFVVIKIALASFAVPISDCAGVGASCRNHFVNFAFVIPLVAKSVDYFCIFRGFGFAFGILEELAATFCRALPICVVARFSAGCIKLSHFFQRVVSGNCGIQFGFLVGIEILFALGAVPVSFGAVFRARCRFFGDDFRCGPNVVSRDC